MEGADDPKSSEKPRKPIEATVLDAEGRVLYEPASARKEDPHSRRGHSVAWGTTVGTRAGTGLIPKLVVGGLFAGVLFLGLTVALAVLAVMVIATLLRLFFKPPPQR